ncbi:MAG: glycerol-3-phosphate acyltransferase [Clostridia bacterium]|nr:glycerol-3-phosphate acyltransferase [Clostridia bacterium]
MPPFAVYCLTVLICYAVGSVNPSYIIGRIRGFDIRERGSKNAGASNAIISIGVLEGVFSMIFDFMKAFGCVMVAAAVLQDWPYIAEAAGSACILGHMFPFYMRFRGGKGLACLGGMILALDWKLFLIFLGAETVILFVSNYLYLVPLTAAIAFPVTWGILQGDAIAALCLCPAAVAIVCKHIVNIKKMIQGKELRFSYLWNKDKELAKIHAGEDDTDRGGENPD